MLATKVHGRMRPVPHGAGLSRKAILTRAQYAGVLPWSPLARGRLARPWDESTERSSTDEFGKSLYVESDRIIVERVADVAAQRHVPPAQVALAWLLAKPVVTAPIVGATKLSHLEDAVAAVDVRLSDKEMALLEEPYRPHEVAGFA